MCHLSNEWLLWRPLKHFLFLVIPEIPLYKYRWSYHCLSISWPSHWHCSWSLDLPTGTAADLLTFPLALQLTSWPSHWHLQLTSWHLQIYSQVWFLYIFNIFWHFLGRPKHLICIFLKAVVLFPISSGNIYVLASSKYWVNPNVRKWILDNHISVRNSVEAA